ncbi:MAG: hypothetical protein RL518_1847 [Pseudomonadota bacterium]
MRRALLPSNLAWRLSCVTLAGMSRELRQPDSTAGRSEHHTTAPREVSPSARTQTQGADSLCSLGAPDLETRTHFWSIVDPFIAAERQPHPVESSEIARRLSILLHDSASRATVWNFIADFGFPCSVSGDLRTSFVCALLPHVTPDDEQSVRGLTRIAQQSVDSGGLELYKIVGQRCLSLDLTSATMAELAGAFTRFETHNMDKEECLQPWSRLFIDRGDPGVFRVFAESIRARVKRNELSSFDHLVSVMCRSDRAEATAELQRLVDREYIPEISVGRLIGDSIKGYCKEYCLNLLPSLVLWRLAKVSPVAWVVEGIAQGTYLPRLGDVLGLSFGGAFLYTAIVGSLKASRRVDAIFRKAMIERIEIEKENDYLDSGAFSNLAEKVYKGLVDNEAQRPGHRALIHALESNEILAHEIGGWGADAGEPA